MQLTKSISKLDSVTGFSDLLKAYVSRQKELSPFYSYSPTAEGFQQLLSAKPFAETDRHLVSEVLLRQYRQAGMTPSASTQLNLDNLAKKNAYTVCTGHQLCLFTGPLYFIYKIISTINLAETLSRSHPDSCFVPVFWMASEDHDFEEINHAQVFGKSLTWTKEEAMGSVASMPAGKIKTDSLGRLFEELQTLLGNAPNAAEMGELLKQAYAPGQDLAAATRNLVNALFGEYGLVIVDAEDALLKKRFSGIMKDELDKAPNEKLVQQGIAALEQIGFGAQVNPREINLFYMTDRLRGRIERTADRSGYLVVGSSLHFTPQEIDKELSEHPERFSPNVVLRPLYQQVILPNLAYIGGPGELAYWLEFKAMFDHHKVVFPILVPRNFVMWVDAASAGKMDKLQLTLEALSGNLSSLEKEYMQRHMEEGGKLEEELNSLKAVYDRIAQKVAAVDATLKAPAEAEGQKAAGGLKNLEAKMLKAEKQKHETALNQLRNVKDKLFPGGVFQERVDNFIPLYLKHGKVFVQTVKASLDPFEHNLIVITEQP
jgi:bacillithiol biosynthesis cysteine-adding enzyme BshC